MNEGATSGLNILYCGRVETCDQCPEYQGREWWGQTEDGGLGEFGSGCRVLDRFLDNETVIPADCPHVRLTGRLIDSFFKLVQDERKLQAIEAVWKLFRVRHQGR